MSGTWRPKPVSPTPPKRRAAAAENRSALLRLKALAEGERPIVDEARRKHSDIMTEPSWSLDYTIEISLSVAELRTLFWSARPYWEGAR